MEVQEFNQLVARTRLTERNQRAAFDCLVLGHRVTEVSEKHGVSWQRVSQICRCVMIWRNRDPASRWDRLYPKKTSEQHDPQFTPIKRKSKPKPKPKRKRRRKAKV